jgi:hypothetical protein
MANTAQKINAESEEQNKTSLKVVRGENEKCNYRSISSFTNPN